MNVVIWIGQGLLAAVFLLAGGLKVSQPIESLSKRMTFVRAVPPPFVRFIGAAEVLGAAGLILPLATGVLPWLTVAAAVGLVIVQLCAAVFHISRGEASRVLTNAALLAMAVFVVIGRLSIVPVA